LEWRGIKINVGNIPYNPCRASPRAYGNVLNTTANFRRRLLRWYDAHHRHLPWRVVAADGAPDPYHVLVSELMLQQTQVATVVPYFHRFLEAFPTLADLAAADEQRVLKAWQGLGYYSRARNLLAAARRVMRDYGGKLPADRRQLLSLPGIGPYTAGGVSSIAYGRREAAVDANVARVLCRLDLIEGTWALQQLGLRAQEILPRGAAMARIGDFNSALMELGATVCKPRRPDCAACPVRRHCEACAAGAQERIPARRVKAPVPRVRRWTYCVASDRRWLIEQRPSRGRWAGLWQFATLDADAPHRLGVAVTAPAPLMQFTHALTHRRYHFQVLLCRAKRPRAALPAGRRWMTLAGLKDYPLPRPHARIAAMLAEITAPRAPAPTPPRSGC